MIAFENKPQLGTGIFTIQEVASILRIPYPQVYRWVTGYWNGRLGQQFQTQYSWMPEGSWAVCFPIVVELSIMIQLAEKGVEGNSYRIFKRPISTEN